MMHNDRVAPQRGTEHAQTFTLVSGNSLLASRVDATAETLGLQLEPAAPNLILVDAPHGFALHFLKTLETQPRCILTITESPCVEYWEDLWDLHIAVLLVNARLEDHFMQAMQQVAAGKRYRISPPTVTPLTINERKVLHLVGQGYTNRQIAEQLVIQDQSIRNMLTNIYQKLRLKSRTEAILYYWGIWHTLWANSFANDTENFKYRVLGE